MILHSIELYLLDLHLKRPVSASYGVESERPVTIIKITATEEDTQLLSGRCSDSSQYRTGLPGELSVYTNDSDSKYDAPVRTTQLSGESLMVGFGECAALASTTYAAESAYSAFEAMQATYIPRLIEWSSRRDGLLPYADELPAVFENLPGNHMAISAIEMAMIDLRLRSTGESFGNWIGARGDSVDAGVVIGIFGDMDLVVNTVGGYVDEGYRRIKMKIFPSWDVEPVKSLLANFAGIMLCVDANGSYTDDSTDCIDRLKNLDKMGLGFIEQPFCRSDLEGTVRLAESMDTPICLDESLDSLDSIRKAASMHAMDVACIKPGRLGGIVNALSALSVCKKEGLQAYIGGMYDTGLARRANASLSAIGMTHFAGDIGGGELFVEGDPFGALNITAGRAALHHSPGIAPMPDATLMEKVCSKKVCFDWNSL